MRIIMCLSVIALLAGCDTSKDELESTKSTLASVTKDRDDLKTQVGSLQQQLASVKADLEKEKAAAAASAEKTATGAKGAAADKAHMASKNADAKSGAGEVKPGETKGKNTHKS
jgi:septal ring factor EnvC (AmiA/AmiB activator)